MKAPELFQINYRPSLVLKNNIEFLYSLRVQRYINSKSCRCWPASNRTGF